MPRWTSLLAALSLALAPPIGAGAAPPPEPPGPDLPPAGRSLFDELFTTADGAAALPFPFSSLLRHVSHRLDAGQPFGGLPVVLIPLGRSLQRHAAGDVDAFRYPRVVAAATGEPPPAALPGHPYLRDRLYIAYHEKAAALEVISYNEAAGRFEFQLVRDYRDGGRPAIGYANRGLCLACHQGAAPIFSRQSWDETSAGAPVAARLAATGLDYYGLAWRHGVDVPDAIDAATARASLLATAQRLWREGCAVADRSAAVGCRAEALRQALRHRLTDGRSATAARLALRPALAVPLLAAWKQRWPTGLAIPDPSLPNRQPFAGMEGGRPPPSDAELHRYADIASAFDPLALRAPLEIWPGRDAADAARFVAALATFFSRADIARIDHALAARSAHAAAGGSDTVRRIALPCRMRESAGRERRDLDCRGIDGALLQARLAPSAARAGRGGSLDRLVLPGSDAIGAAALAATAGAPGAGMRLLPARDGRPLRAAGGERLRRIDVLPAAARHGDGADATAELELVADLAPLDAAIDRLAEATLAGRSDALDDGPLRRAAVLPPLLAALGIPLPPASPRAGAIAPRLADPIAVRADPWPDELQPFARQCGHCHAATTAFPPGFLHGDDDQVRRQIASCAERMLFRLAMNTREPAARPKTPMPPPAATHAAALVQSADYAAMTRLLEASLAQRRLAASDVLARPYATLAPCAAGAD